MDEEKQAQRHEWRERQRRSRASRADQEHEDGLIELANELKRAIRQSPDRAVPRSFFAEYGVTKAMEVLRFLKLVGPAPDQPIDPPVVQGPPMRITGWWIGKSSSEIQERLVRENPVFAKFFDRNTESVPEVVEENL